MLIVEMTFFNNLFIFILRVGAYMKQQKQKLGILFRKRTV